MFFWFPKVIIDVEYWKYNKEFKVYVSNLGHIKDKKGLDIKINTTNTGYLAVKIKNKAIPLHRLVLYTFKPTIYAAKLTVDHIDHNKRNNKLKNLRWMTEKENKRLGEQDKIDIDVEEFEEKNQSSKENFTNIFTFGTKRIFFAKLIANDKHNQKLYFESYNEAIDFLKNKNNKDVQIKTVDNQKFVDGITKAIIKGKCYFGYYWSYTCDNEKKE